jgi:hypothetical protein
MYTVANHTFATRSLKIHMVAIYTVVMLNRRAVRGCPATQPPIHSRAASQRSASSAAIQPAPAAVTACR